VQRIVARVDASRRGILKFASEGDEAFIKLMEDGHADQMQRTIDFIRIHEDFFSDALVN
jgi:hypothetical protein